jgi:hypothetical protein
MNPESMPSLITLNEFCAIMGKKKTYPIESIGGFVVWIQKKGCPKKWPLNMWEKELKEYTDRKV